MAPLQKTDPKVKSAWDNIEAPILNQGRAIILPAEPEAMPPEKAIEALQRKIADENQPYDVHEIIDAYPTDAAIAFVKATKELYGFASPVSTWFSNPQMLSIKTGPGPDDVVQCPIGKFKLPGIDSPINTQQYFTPKGPAFVIYATVKKKDRHLLLELANKTREIVARESIYKGKAIRLEVDEEGALNLSSVPEFIDVSDTSESNLIFDENVTEQINTNILVPIKYTSTCKEQGIPLKRGVLLEGPYGTGKSLTARMTARVAQDNGWTFILLNRVQGLRAALEFANRYAPAVVFAEDIDRIAHERSEETNDLINTIDGVVSKRSEIMTILTTNHVDSLNPVILRPGRLDAVISLRAPNAKTVERLIRFYARDLVTEDTDLTGAGTELEGQIPASIRECVERAKLGMIGRGAKTLSSIDLEIAAQTMKNHLALLNKGQKKELSAAEKLAQGLQGVVNGSESDPSDLEETIDNMHTRIQNVQKGVKHIEQHVCQ